MLKKSVSILLLISIIIIGFTYKAELLQLINQDGPNAIFISMLLIAICAFFPLVPFTLLAGMNGAIFGIAKGMLISYSGAMAGTILFFFICRYGFKDWAQYKLKKYPKVHHFEEYLNRNSFLAILTGRLIPVIPAPAFNLACGVSSVKWQIFFLASALGKIPNIVMLSLAGANVSHNLWFSFSLYGSYLFTIFMISLIIIYKKNLKTSAERK